MESLMEICFVDTTPCGLVRILFSRLSTTGWLATTAGLLTGAEAFDFRNVWVGKGRITTLSVSLFFFQTLVSVNRVA
jgi:hypothetical protein